MGTIEEIQEMLEEGRTEQEIINILKRRGLSEREIVESISQAKIKDAVTAEGEFQPLGLEQENQERSEIPPVPSPISEHGESPTEQASTNPISEYPLQYENYGYEGMQPSVTMQESQIVQEPQIAQEPQYTEQYTEPSPYAYPSYPQYQPYQETTSSDIITEISEQVVSEKLSFIRDKLEKTIDFKTIAETKIASIEERLKKIEQIMDKLQMSVLQRVTEYVGDVKDIKNELEETQKSFQALLPTGKEHHIKHHKHKTNYHKKHTMHHLRHAHHKIRRHKGKKHEKRK